MIEIIKNILRPGYVFVINQIGIYRLKKAIHSGNIRIVIGAGGFYEKGWAVTEIDYLNLLNENDWKRFFSKKKIDVILAEHVWEHLDRKDGLLAAKNCHAFLKPGGRLRIAVPDGNHSDPEYIEKVKPGGHGAGSDDHKILYTINSLTELLEEAGFRVKGLEYFDENHKFIRNDWNPEDGKIYRSKRFDQRNSGEKLAYTSLIVDAIK
ncbi:MAG: methyltransferase domain-containing protein [Bacteroidales bacterium]|nr:methyltransferase domain-containing protein [Bacteroidales bacterium]MCB8998736.1 methyltransferase domain-containing protein [Bacteroidales bacterium]